MHLGSCGEMNKSFFTGKNVLVTGHTGFKGSWLCRELYLLGANVYGYSLKPPTNPNLYTLAHLDDIVDSRLGDIRDFDKLYSEYEDIKPDIVIHMAAQPIVREGYRNPRETYETNVMGTVNLFECIRLIPCAKSILNVTTDKVYENLDDGKCYREYDKLNGRDPYSNSKSCSELVTHSYLKSFLENCSVSTARAGNVIGGGDFAQDRIIPDCVKAAMDKKTIFIRNPRSIRPYQHVLEPLFTYMTICKKQYGDKTFEGSYNIGPDELDCVTTGSIADMFCNYWGDGLNWTTHENNGPYEANYLKLDNGLLKKIFGISPLWNVDSAVSKVVEWTKSWLSGADPVESMDAQIKEYLNGRGVYV